MIYDPCTYIYIYILRIHAVASRCDPVTGLLIKSDVNDTFASLRYPYFNTYSSSFVPFSFFFFFHPSCRFSFEPLLRGQKEGEREKGRVRGAIVTQ